LTAPTAAPEEMLASDRGVAVRIKDSASVRYAVGKKKRTWKDIIDINMPVVTNRAGDSVKSIKNLSAAYGCPVIIELSSDIRSTASLLLTMAADIRPGVVSDGNEFAVFQKGRYSLNEADEKEGRRMVITSRKVSSDPDEILFDPLDGWDDLTVWMYVMRKAEPFDPVYMHGKIRN